MRSPQPRLKPPIALKNVHCKVSDEPAHHTLKQGRPHDIKFINDQSGNDFIASYKEISKTTSQSCLVSDVFSAGVGFGLKCVLTI